jgi:ubiquitin carboxyl-terminal hydrolase 4/11
MSDSELDKSPISTKRAREASIGEEEQATTVTDPKDQLKIVTQLQEQHLKDNETWCLVSKTWYTRWKQYCSRLNSPAPEVRNLGQQSPPGPINNISILSNGKLAEDLVLDDTVYAVPESAWDELISWYIFYKKCKRRVSKYSYLGTGLRLIVLSL